ncbi:MAG: hypothetical protein H6850_01755 [Alphaproteobacteria bacterium]|nr:MAG: hypothetical protein H6850_01755 [Alphaproteobacteria bacterium]
MLKEFSALLNQIKKSLFYIILPDVFYSTAILLLISFSAIYAYSSYSTILLSIGLAFFIVLITTLSKLMVYSSYSFERELNLIDIINKSLGKEICVALSALLLVSEVLSIVLGFRIFKILLSDLLNQYYLKLFFPVVIIGLNVCAIIFNKYKNTIHFFTLGLFIVSIAMIAKAHYPTSDAYESFTVLAHQKFSFWTTFALFFPVVTNFTIEFSKSAFESMAIFKKTIYRKVLETVISLALVGFLCILFLNFYSAYVPKAFAVSHSLAIVKNTPYPIFIFMYLFSVITINQYTSLKNATRIIVDVISLNSGRLWVASFAQSYKKLIIPLLIVFLTLFVTYSIDYFLPIFATVYLINFGCINLIALINLTINKPIWRPVFRIPALLPLMCSIFCFIGIFLINAGLGFSIILIMLGLYFVMSQISYKKDSHDLRSNFKFYLMKQLMNQLSESETNQSSWVPQFLIINESLQDDKNMIYFIDTLAKSGGLCSLLTVAPETWQNKEKLLYLKSSMKSFIKKHELNCLAEIVTPEEDEDLLSYIQAYGIGPIKPNTVVRLIEGDKLSKLDYKIVQVCQKRQKNVLFYKEPAASEFSLDDPDLNISLWWDSKARDSIDLSLNFLSTIQNTCQDFNRKVKFYHFSESKESAEAVETYLENFIRVNRIKADIEVVVVKRMSDAPQFLQNSDLVFVPLRAAKTDESDADYQKYLLGAVKSTAELKRCIYVIALDDVNHYENYEAQHTPSS